MEELSEVWEQLIAEAKKNPQNIEREGLADFIAVKAANDEIREACVSRLFETLRSAAEHANQKNAGIAIESSDDHRFALDAMRLGGRLIRFRQGIRSMTVEAGWTRTPADGFMRGNALAIARISHFGGAQHNAELHLLTFDSQPRWFTITKLGLRVSFEIEDLVRHFQIFLGVV